MMQKKALLFIIAVLILFAFVWSPLAGLWVKADLERAMKTQVVGEYHPTLFFPAFKLQNVHFTWQDRIEVLSGDIQVQYNLLSFFSSGLLRVQISSQNLSAKLLGNWSQMEQISSVNFQELYADLGFGPKGLQEVSRLKVKSPVLDFEIKETISLTDESQIEEVQAPAQPVETEPHES